MAQFSRIESALALRKSGIVPVFYNADIEVCIKITRLCHDAGMRVFEFTNRGELAYEVFSGLIKIVKSEMPGMILGAGSIVDPYTTAMYIQSGANFIVSPVLNEEMARICNRRKILWSPGCGSVSEISKAEELGAEVVKVFPAKEVGGPAFIKNIRGPMPWTNIMPTGGVDLEYDNLKQWFEAGAWCLGMGSKLFPQEFIDKKDYDAIKKRIVEAVALVEKVKKDLKIV